MEKWSRIKTFITLTAVFVCLALLFAGCSRSPNELNHAENENNTIAGTADKQTGASVKPDESNAGEQSRRQRPDAFGKVQKIVGNEVTLAIAEMPEKPNMPEATQQGKNSTGSGDNQPSQSSYANGAGVFIGGPSGGGPGGPGGNGPPEVESSGQRPASLDNVRLTGESVTFLIPVGTPIISMGRGESGTSQTSLEVKDIKKGAFLSVVFAKESSGEEKMASEVRVMQK